MKKKILAVLLSIVMTVSFIVPTFALDLGDLGGLIGGLGGNSEDSSDSSGTDIKSIINQIINNADVQDIISSVTSSDGVADVTQIVIQLVASLNKDTIKQMGIDQLKTTLQSLVNTIAGMIKQVADNKDLIVVYDPQAVINYFFGTSFTTETTTEKDTTKDPNELTIGPGDVDTDGKITAADARLILRRAAKLVTFTPEQDKLADVDGDGRITSNDAREVLRVSANLITIEEIPTRAKYVATTIVIEVTTLKAEQ